MNRQIHDQRAGYKSDAGRLEPRFEIGYFRRYHLGRMHHALRVTPAMEAGIAEHVRSLRRESAQFRADRAGVIVNRIPTRIGDVLILETTQSYTIYGVGKVSKDGQQDFGSHTDITYADDRASAVIQANALVAPGRKIFFRNIDTGEWSEISH